VRECNQQGKLRHFTDFGVLLPANSDKSSSGSDVWVPTPAHAHLIDLAHPGASSRLRVQVIGVAVAVPIAVVLVVGVIAGAVVWSFIQRKRARSTQGGVSFDSLGDENEDEAL
jgi:hypothetical protein